MVRPVDPHLFLIVPDEQMRGLLRKYAAKNGFFVTTGRDPDHARRLLAGLDFDLIVLDTRLGDTEPAPFIMELREECAAPIVALSLSESACASARAAGAEAALSLPFDPPALLDKINTVLDRSPPDEEEAAPRLLRLGAMRYDLDRGELWFGEEMVRLTATESTLMRALAAHAGEALGRGALIEKLGKPGDPAQDRAIDVQVTRLRRKLEPDPKRPRYLQTVRGAGYMLEPD